MWKWHPVKKWKVKKILIFNHVFYLSDTLLDIYRVCQKEIFLGVTEEWVGGSSPGLGGALHQGTDLLK